MFADRSGLGSARRPDALAPSGVAATGTTPDIVPECLGATIPRLTGTPGRTVARGEEHTRRVTFGDGDLLIMISIDANLDGTVRLDGWLAPGQPCGVEVHSAAVIVDTKSDDAGRFVLHSVPQGLARLVVRGCGVRRRTVTTPIIEL